MFREGQASRARTKNRPKFVARALPERLARSSENRAKIERTSIQNRAKIDPKGSQNKAKTDKKSKQPRQDDLGPPWVAIFRLSTRRPGAFWSPKSSQIRKKTDATNR